MFVSSDRSKWEENGGEKKKKEREKGVRGGRGGERTMIVNANSLDSLKL